ncbi:MAG: energy-coupling factor transporter transmembrane protein EcfT, partial [Clostridiales bacterium]|nr:energy-coupling factor transporter transmembrane protein EcfT [Clostridiales bacterium]
MTEGFSPKKPLYPVISVLSCILILAIGLVTAKKMTGLYYLAAVWALFLALGFWKSCLKILPFAAVVCGLFGGLTYLVSRDVGAVTAAICRGLAVSAAAVPGLSMSPARLCRNLSKLGAPRSVTLGAMIAVGFFPLLLGEIRQVREAMRTRGTGG